jgi:hypothetical protein
MNKNQIEGSVKDLTGKVQQGVARATGNASRIDTFGASGEAESADPADETVINGAPYDAHNTIRSGADNPAIPADAPDARIVEEIRRRQRSLALRYVVALRAR